MPDQLLQNTLNSRPRGTVSREDGKSYLYLIFDRYDPRDPKTSILKPSMIERVIFVQDLEDRNTLFALVAVFKRNLAVLIPSGIFHLEPGHPKRSKLDEFRDWLDEHGISERDLRFVEPGGYERINTLGVVRAEDFSSRVENEIKGHFISWRIGSDLPFIGL